MVGMNEERLDALRFQGATNNGGVLVKCVLNDEYGFSSLNLGHAQNLKRVLTPIAGERVEGEISALPSLNCLVGEHGRQSLSQFPLCVVDPPAYFESFCAVLVPTRQTLVDFLSK